MVLIEKILIFLGCTVVGILILKYTEPIVRNIGAMSWAENRFGPGRTYTVWKLIGVAIIVGGLVYVTTVQW